MNTLGWLFILGGLLLVRQVSKGRVMFLGKDLSDAFQAVASGDQQRLSEVLSRTGEANTPAVLSPGNVWVDPKPEGSPTAVTPEKNVALLNTVESLGSAAKGYRFASSGPDYYDCSGLVWRACKQLGFKGVRFTTATIQASKSFKRLGDPTLGVSNVMAGDIVLWPAHHMGVVSSMGKFYSARSVKTGIGESNIAGFGGYGNPIYLRYVG